MSVINDVLEAVIGLAEETEPYAPILVGALPADNGLCMCVANGSADTVFMTKGSVFRLSLAFNGKHTDAKVVSDTLNDIHQVLSQAKDYPQTDEYQIMDIETETAPQMIDREANSQILFGSFLRVRFFYKKGEQH